MYKKKILFVCDFNSVHSRSLIKSFLNYPELEIYVISSFDAPEMQGVSLNYLSKGSLGDKNSLKFISDLVLRISPHLYRSIVAFMFSRRTKQLIEAAQKLPLISDVNIIHALRTQPEGIIAQSLLKKYKAKLFLTTWGQDFVLLANSNSWLKRKTLEVVGDADFIFPDNIRDDEIIKKVYGFESKKTLVLPATGGIDINGFNALELNELPEVSGNYNFLTTRGYDNSYVNLKVLIYVFKEITKIFPSAHFYIDLHSKINPDKDLKIRSWIKKLEIENVVTLLHLKREEMFAYMNKCQFHVSATYSDGMPMSLLESLFFGQIPIVFDHQSTRNLKEEFDYFYSFHSYEVEDIKKVWLDVLSRSVPPQSEIRRKNMLKIAEKYEKEANLQKIYSCYIDN